MYQKDILETMEGRREDGNPRACACLQILNMENLDESKSDRENLELVETIRQVFTVYAEVKFAVNRDLVTIDLIFEDRTDYDFLQFIDTVREYEDYNHKTPLDEREQYLLLTISQTEQPESYVNAIAGSYVIQSSNPAKDLGDTIRFICREENVFTLELPEEDAEELEQVAL